MSPCCTPIQQRGPLPHTNLSWNPLLHFDLFELAGWNDSLVYSFIVCPYSSLVCIDLFIFDLLIFVLLLLILSWLLQAGYIYPLQPVSSQHPALLPFIKPHFRHHNHHHPHVEQAVVVIKVAVPYASMPLGLMLFIMLMASSSLSGFLTSTLHHSPAPQCYLNAVYIKGRTLLVSEALGLLFARWNLFCLCTFITPFLPPSLFLCLNLPVSLSLLSLSVLSSF